MANALLEHPGFELAFVWNRTKDILRNKFHPDIILDNLECFHEKKPDLVVEVCHPCISKDYGIQILKHCDYLIGSPTALADPDVESKLKRAAREHAVYIPSGAFWGAEDIRKMADNNTLLGLKVTMKKHQSCFKLSEPLLSINEAVTNEPVILYEGSVRKLCPLAPNNVNTMAAAAIAAHNLGFDRVEACLVADPKLLNRHVVEIEVTGPSSGTASKNFTVKTVRDNPAAAGAVTGNATYGSFFSSLLGAMGKQNGIHLC